VIGGALKIVYDLLLYRAFRHIRPPEEDKDAAAAADGKNSETATG
jgi:hypothetical protein